MLKLIRLSAALFVGVAIVSFPQIVRSRPESGTSNRPAVRSSQAGSLFCYMRTQQGATLNLENLCRASDSSGNADTAASVPNNSASTTPSETTSNETPGRGRVIITINGATVPNTPASTNTSNPNGTNTSANTSNPNATNTSGNSTSNGTTTSTNISNPNATNTSGNSTSNGTTTSTNTSNFGGTNTSGNSTPNGTTTSTNTGNFSGTNTSGNSTSNGTNTSTNNQR